MRTTPYLVGLSYVALCGVAIAASRQHLSPEAPFHPAVAAGPAEAFGAGSGAAWFASAKPFCNTLEVATALEQHRPPPGADGTAHEAACLALAGKIDRARSLIAGLESDQQWRAAGVVFGIAHPVADAGDDRSAGPIMAMVVDFWPNHYMALYHAGMAEFALGDLTRAEQHLKAFLQYYSIEDGFRAAARGALKQLAQ